MVGVVGVAEVCEVTGWLAVGRRLGGWVVEVDEKWHGGRTVLP